MRRRGARLAVALAVVVTASVAFAVPNQLGVSYTPWGDDLTDPGTAVMLGQSFDDMVSTGVSWVALNPFEFMSTSGPLTMGPIYPPTGYSTSAASLQKAVDELKARGIKILLKPMLNPDDGSWRGSIAPTPQFFAGYKTWINAWADQATAWGVDGFSVGCEFKATVGADTAWRNIIEGPDGVRDHYSGPLTYAANHDSYASVGWWDALDYVGIDAYFKLTNLDDPAQGQLDAAWTGHANVVEAWLAALNATLPPDEQKQVIFAEIGYRNRDGTNKAPWDWGDTLTSTDTDPAEQAACYLAALSQTWERDWMAGYYWWNWVTDPAGSPYPTDYPPQGNPWAMHVLKQYYYIPEPATLALLGVGVLGLLRRRRK